MVTAIRTVEILADKSALIERSRDLIVSQIRAAIAASHKCTIALAGGSTPKPVYEALANESLPWSKIYFFWGDERYVPATHKDSNQLMVRQALLNKIKTTEDNILAIDTTGKNPLKDAAKYEFKLRQFFQLSQGFPSFDLILLGMGDDGHTASLFPNTESLKVKDKLITVGNKNGQPRLTFTIPLINHAKCVLFMVSGANKSHTLQQVFAAKGNGMEYPSRLVQPQEKLLWLLDSASASYLQ